MTDLCRETLLAASELLAYPDERLLGRLPAIGGAVARLPRGPRRELEGFLAYLRSGDPVGLAERYVATFDFAGGADLYLTHPAHGDDRSRGPALVEIKRRYRAAGLEPLGGELPDFLPMVLEFLGLADRDSARALARAHLPAVRSLAQSLRAGSSPYRLPVSASVRAMRELLRGEDRGRAAR